MNNLVFGGDDVVELNSLSSAVRPVVDFAESLLAKKRSENGEIIVTLFELCNLSCKFCNQDHGSTAGMENISGKFHDVIKAIELMRKMRKTSFTVNLMGGEIFQDGFPESQYLDYMSIVEDVHVWAKLRDLDIKFAFISNLVHFNTARIKLMISQLRDKGIDVGLGTSYDPAMRFSVADMIVFRRNLEIYGDLIQVVNVVLTKPNIAKFLSGQTPHWDYIYEHFDVFFDYYTPESNHAIMSPMDHELRDMFVWLAENYPKAAPVASWMNFESNPMTCQSTYTIQSDGRAGRCTILLNNFQKEVAPHTAGEMEHEFVTKMDCMSCEYFARCGLGCFLQQHFNGPNRSLPDCWMKDVHRRIDEVKSVR